MLIKQNVSKLMVKLAKVPMPNPMPEASQNLLVSNYSKSKNPWPESKRKMKH
jgi:hypothetical protein